jgi:hypothetical protein
MTPAVKMVERALAAWHQAIIAAPETEEVDARRRRCMRAALSAALPLPVEGVDAAIKRLWPNGLGPKNLDELVVFVEEERKCDAEYLANAVKIVQSERAKRYLSALTSPSAEAAQPVADETRALVEKLWGALNFILAFYEPGQRYLDTEAWKHAEAGGRAAHKAAREWLDAPAALSQPQGELREALIAAKRALEIVVPSGEHGRQVKAEAVATIDAALAGRTAG